jgi:4-diphosphocytidyl-2-C-methyl-D-erythritol kinase
MIHVFAPSKVNLALHVTRQRADGYHELDSVVVLLDCGDQITIEPNNTWVLCADGPFAAQVPLDQSNLITKAARWLENWSGRRIAAKITLTKYLPPASGIGGGSSDAAAAIKGLCQLMQMDLPPAADLAQLGADVPVCMGQGLMRMQGIGERITPYPNLPDMAVLLVNPGVHVPTPAVFRGLQSKTNPALTDQSGDWFEWIASQRNDLEPPARLAEPVIDLVLECIRATDDVCVTRMSGSGATCFGIYRDHAACFAAREHVARAHPDWWTAIGRPITIH